MEGKFNYNMKLFTTTLYLSAFTFGGGYVIVPLMKKKFVDEYKWVQDEEMIDLIAIAQAAPGIMAVNTAIIIGHKLNGYKGALIATFGTIIPPIIVLSLISIFYDAFSTNNFIALMLTGMKAAVAAVVLNVAYTMFTQLLKSGIVKNTLLFIIAFIAAYILKVNVLYIILGSILIGIGLIIIRGVKK